MAGRFLFETHGRIDVWKIDPDNLVVDEELRGRISIPDFTSLKESIKAEGQLEPILARKAADGSVHVVAGFTRHAAIKALKTEEPDKGWAVLTRILPGVNDAAGFAMALAENMVRQDLSPMEAANGVQKLRVVYNQSAQDVAHSLGRSVGWVYQMEKIAGLPAKLQKHVHSRDISVVVALELAEDPGWANRLKDLLDGKGKTEEKPASTATEEKKPTPKPKVKGRAAVTKKDLGTDAGPTRKKILATLDLISGELYIQVEDLVKFLTGKIDADALVDAAVAVI